MVFETWHPGTAQKHQSHFTRSQRTKASEAANPPVAPGSPVSDVGRVVRSPTSKDSDAEPPQVAVVHLQRAEPWVLREAHPIDAPDEHLDRSVGPWELMGNQWETPPTRAVGKTTEKG